MLTKAATVRKFRQAARQRLTTAEFLLRHRMYLDAKYLGGYGIECALKALIFRRTPDRAFAAMFKRLTSGKKAHDYEALKGILKSSPINQSIPASLAVSFQRVASWATSLRYEVGRGNPKDTAAFFEAAREIVRWVENVL
ncbi:MAG TPA: HEPN domain-containing protein [Gemmataceae bacterium]|nr:HEPN domain-containing protein [Gemmataceae bacterium]